MVVYTSFGEFFKRKRIETGLTLREFCKEKGLDAGNISKIERGLIAPPKSEGVREKYAKVLGIEKSSDDWLTFCDLASAASGTIPSDIKEDERLMRALPLFFRTIRDSKNAEHNLKKLVNYIREQLK